MKKKLFLGMLAAAAVTFTSCQKDEVLNSVPQDQPIEFGTYVGRGAQTKAVSIDNAAALQAGSGFGVFAYYTDGAVWDETAATFQSNFMNNQKVSYIGSAWSYSPVKYWPNEANDKLSFIAYYPHKEGSSLKPDAIEFELNDDVKAQYDLMYDNSKNYNLNKQLLADKVKFNFAHALSRIGINVAAAVDQVDIGGTLAAETVITVNKVTIHFIGDYYKKAKLDLFTGIWSYSELATTKDFSWSIETPLPSNAGSFLYPNYELKGEQTEYKQLNDNDSYLMFLPQNTNFKITVDYTVTTYDSQVDGGNVSVRNVITSGPIYNYQFYQGKAYTFNLLLGMNSVDFEAEITAWEKVEHKVDVPLNK